ncbi:MAG: hypothetical protein A3J38_09290 [Gammaproteobacteria bacterium RIFCSPHIGHO2_12_FULL_45_9]|nr:MAG: hypothetical protein A3J38_09290 [Gammaproteobacteria bacterium RIFCSPHIGHO2_12_FULL_45_9]
MQYVTVNKTHLSNFCADLPLVWYRSLIQQYQQIIEELLGKKAARQVAPLGDALRFLVADGAYPSEDTIKQHLLSHLVTQLAPHPLDSVSLLAVPPFAFPVHG